VKNHSSFQYSSCSLIDKDKIDSISFVSSSCYQRRRLLGTLTILTTYNLWMPLKSVSAAVTSSSIMQQDSKQAGGGGVAGESLRRSAPSMIPGLGPSDIFYPESFVGSWNMNRQVVLSDDNSIILTLNYPIRFLSSLNVNGKAAAVADRGYNQAALENALRRSGASSSSSSSSTPPVNNVVQSYTWSASNPNDLSIFFTNGSSKEIKVTKRAASIIVNAAAPENASASAVTTTIDSSEFQRVTLDDQTVPVISARRVLTKWKVIMDNPDVVEGLELVYDMTSVGFGSDPLTLTQQQQQPPKLLSKSRLRITRIRS
jgi:hypothetical protein